MDVRFGISNVRSPYSVGSLRTVTEEISKYKLDLMGVQKSGGTEVAQNQPVNLWFSLKGGT
jgi:hypothetical protein